METSKELLSAKTITEKQVAIEDKHYHFYLVNARWKRDPEAAFNIKEIYGFVTFTVKALSFPTNISLQKFALSKGAEANELTITSITEVPKNWDDEK